MVSRAGVGEQRIELAAKLEPLLAAEAKKRQQAGGEKKLPQNSAEAGDTRDAVAKAAGVTLSELLPGNSWSVLPPAACRR